MKYSPTCWYTCDRQLEGLCFLPEVDHHNRDIHLVGFNHRIWRCSKVDTDWHLGGLVLHYLIDLSGGSSIAAPLSIPKYYTRIALAGITHLGSVPGIRE